MVGRVVSNFKILEKLGDGGMGSVYRGVDTMLDRPVAIKVLHAHVSSQPGIIERFRSEATLLAKLNHANIATLYSFFREGDEFFMVMELIPGVSISDWARAHAPLTARRATELMIQVLAGLEHAHELGVVHRDIKPANVLVTEQGAVKITDFGIGRALGSERLTREARLVGTMEYLAPERIQGEPGDARADIYSAGVVLYELLTNRIPFERNSDFELMRAHLEDQPAPVRQFSAHTPEQLGRIVEKALAKKPDQRYACAAEMRNALLAIDWSFLPEDVAAAPDPKATRMVDLPVPGTRLAESLIHPVIQKKPAHGYGRWIGLACAAVLLLALLFFIRPGRNAPSVPVANDPEAAQPAPAKAATSAAEPVVASPTQSSADVPVVAQDLPGARSNDSSVDEQAKKREAARAKRRAEALRALDR